MEQLADSQISVGGWGDEIKRFFQTSLDAAGKKIGSKFEVVKDVDEAIDRIVKGEFAYYENIYFLRHASVHRQLLVLGKLHSKTLSKKFNNSNKNFSYTQKTLQKKKEVVKSLKIYPPKHQIEIYI